MPLGRGPHLLEFCHIKSQASKKELLWRHSPSIPGRTHQPTTHPPTTSRPSTHRPRASAVIWPHFPTESSRRPNRPANGGFHLRSDDETGIFGLDGWKVTRENPICYVYRSTITLLVFWKSTVLERNKKNRTGFHTPTEFGQLLSHRIHGTGIFGYMNGRFLLFGKWLGKIYRSSHGSVPWVSG